MLSFEHKCAILTNNGLILRLMEYGLTSGEKHGGKRSA